MSEFGPIKDHPLSKEIIAKLLSGSSPKDVSQWLKIKYTDKDQKHLRLSQKILKEFNDSQYTNYYEQFQEDLASLTSSNKNDKELSYTLTNIKPYRERMEELADKQLNSLTTIEKNMGIILTRFEQMYDMIQNDPTNAKFDNTFIKYMNLIKDGMETIERMKLNSVDNLAQHNFTVQAMQDNINVIQDAVRETLAEMDTNLSSIFMDKLYNKLNNLQPVQQMTPEQRLEEAKRFEAKVLETSDLNG